MLNFDIALNNNEKMGGYLALPDGLNKGTTAPCVIVIQEIFGVNDIMRGKCDWLARQGFIALAPDLFWRFDKGIELSDSKEDELNQAFDYFGRYDVEQGIQDIAATYDALKIHPNSNGNVGAIGYCLGGKLAYLTACQTNVKASVGYYGVGIEEQLAKANNIAGNLMLHIAEEDGFVSPDAQKEIHNALGNKENITLYSYPKCDHAFARENGDNYNAKSAVEADNRTISFLNDKLKS